MKMVFQLSYPNWQFFKLGTKIFFPSSLEFFHQLILQDFSLILYFLHDLQLSSALKQLLFQQNYSLLLGWLLIAQAQYQNWDKGCEEITRQGKDLCNTQKWRKVVAIWKSNKLVLSKKCISLKTRDSENRVTLRL